MSSSDDAWLGSGRLSEFHLTHSGAYEQEQTLKRQTFQRVPHQTNSTTDDLQLGHRCPFSFAFSFFFFLPFWEPRVDREESATTNRLERINCVAFPPPPSPPSLFPLSFPLRSIRLQNWQQTDENPFVSAAQVRTRSRDDSKTKRLAQPPEIITLASSHRDSLLPRLLRAIETTTFTTTPTPFPNRVFERQRQNMETTSFTSRRQATGNLPQFALSLPPPDMPSMRYPIHLPAILSPRSNDSHVGSREATVALASTAAAAAPTNMSTTTVTESYSQITMPSPQPFLPHSSSSSSSNTIRTVSTIPPPPPPPSRITRDGSVANSSILTPKPGIASEGLSPSPGANSGSSFSSQPAGGGLYYNPMQSSSWTSTGGSHGSAYTYAAANPSQASGSSPVVAQPFPTRPPMYGGGTSPSLPQFPGRTSSTSTGGENMPNPPTYQDQSTFPTPIGPGGAPTLGSTYPPPQVPSQHASLAQPILNSQSSNGAQPHTPTGQQQQQLGTPGGTQPGPDGQTYRAPPTPNSYYPPSSTPQQSSYPAFPGPPHQSPTAHSPTTSSAASSRALSALSGGISSSMGYGAGRGQQMAPLGSYAGGYHHMPGGAVLSNMHQPGAPLSVIGGMPGVYHPYSQHHGHHHLYGSHGPPPGDRPFKCDQCPQSFNRNHDLKRHKRIHLAVKPFPCAHCDKSFSRKDALKVSWEIFPVTEADSRAWLRRRFGPLVFTLTLLSSQRHKLVKGCGSKGEGDGGSVTSGASPPDRSENTPEDASESLIQKREP